MGCGGLDFVGSSPPVGTLLPPREVSIEVQFDHAVAPEAASAAPVVLMQGDERIPIRVSVAGDGQGLRVQPLVALRPGVDATLLVGAGVTGLGRRRTREPVELAFAVRSGAEAPSPMKSPSFQLQGGVGPANR